MQKLIKKVHKTFLNKAFLPYRSISKFSSQLYKNIRANIKKFFLTFFFSWHNIKMDPNNIRLHKRIRLYSAKDQDRKDTYFEYEDAYNYYDIDVNQNSII